MADISNVQAIAFTNLKARPFADRLLSSYRTAKQFMIDVVEFESATAGNADGDVILDGSATDGRTILAKVDIAALKFVCEQFIAMMETSDRVPVTDKCAVNSQPLY